MQLHNFSDEFVQKELPPRSNRPLGLILRTIDGSLERRFKKAK
jgi:hypothetical protein